MIPGLKILLEGPSGSGKTHALRTLVDAGLEPFCLLTEPNAVNTILNTNHASPTYIKALEEGKVHWNVVAPAQPSWSAMEDAAKMVTNFDLGTLQKQPGIKKPEYAQIMDLLAVCSNFVDQNGKEFGPVDNFDEGQVFWLDSMSGMNIIMMDHVVGGKPIRTQPDWGVAMDNQLRLLNRFCFGVNSHFVCVAHVVRETDMIMGGIKTVVNALGKKNAPEIPKYFNDVILTQREGTDFTWSTATSTADTKATTLPWGEKMEPTFVPFVEEWERRAILAGGNASQ